MTQVAGSAATALARTRAGVAAAFFTQGFVFISLTTRLPTFSDHWSLSDLELSLLLLMLVLLAGVGSVTAERLAPRVGSAACSAVGSRRSPPRSR